MKEPTMSRKRRVLIASDHAGLALKAELLKAFPGIEWKDLGPESGERVDYPDFAERLCERLLHGDASEGVLVCGSGIGMAIAANKMPGIRAAVVENPVAARLAREHNHANVLCLGARFVAPEYGAELVRAWLEALPSTPGSRHAARVAKIDRLEKKYGRKGARR
jgi:RpiB/LacA/LacB family sugar-phosphate isomerase